MKPLETDMLEKKRFSINNTRHQNGPSIFGTRLKNSLIDHGWKWDPLRPQISFIFSSGFFRPLAKNILRLDGLYFDLSNTIGNSDQKNRPIIKAYNKADGVIFQSHFDRELFKHFIGPTKCNATVISNGAPETFSPEGNRMDYGYEQTILCSARWRRHKRLDCIINGFLEYGNPNTGLIVIGDKIENPIEHPNIRYLGRIPHHDLPCYLRGADAFIHLSWLDHCPNTVVEALCCGLPVLCSHNGGTREIVGDNGIIIHCEEDFEFKKVNQYDPPQCNKQHVAKGIEQILRWNKKVEAEHLKIEKIAAQYADFALSVK